MKLYTDEELEMIGKKVNSEDAIDFEELEDYPGGVVEEGDIDFEALEEDIPTVKESRIGKIKNWLAFRKEQRKLNQEFKLDNDIPSVKESKFQKVKNKISSVKENIKTKRQLRKEERKLNQEFKLDDDIPSVKESKFQKVKNKISSVKENIKIKRQLRKEEKELRRQEKKNLNSQSKIKWNVIKSFVKCSIPAIISCIALAGAFIAATSVFTIGVLPTLGITTCFLLGYKIENLLFKNNIEEFKALLESNDNNIEISKQEVEKEEKQEKKIGLFKRIKKHFHKSNEQEITTSVAENERVIDVEPEELKPVDNLNIVSDDLAHVKLTRDQKIAEVKAECPLGYIKNLNTYCVFTPKENVKLQKFITTEYKKEYPKEKIQSFVAGDRKVLVLSNRPHFK